MDVHKQTLKSIRQFIEACKLLNEPCIINMTNVEIWNVLGYIALCECNALNQEWENYELELCRIMEKNSCNYYQAMGIYEILNNEESYNKKHEYTSKTSASSDVEDVF